MINFSRIFAIISRHLIPTFRDPIRITDMMYYPIIDLLLFGFLVIWAQSNVNDPHNLLMFLTCLICWFLMWRNCIEISRNLLMEIWDNHLINLFASPISITELMIALMLIGTILSFITLTYNLFIVWLLFSKNLIPVLFSIFPYIPTFVICGWIVGSLTSILILYFGKSVEFVIWAIPSFFAVLSGAYYPLSLFPEWFQKIAMLFPGGYAFQGVRHTISTGTISFSNLFVGFFFAIIYFLASMFLLMKVFNRSKQRGLTRLE